jgi:hypothetical protein
MKARSNTHSDARGSFRHPAVAEEVKEGIKIEMVV